jgi:hypothetical protein
MLIPPQQSPKEFVRTGPKVKRPAIPPWVLIAAGVGALVLLAVIAYVVIQNNVTPPSKKAPKGSSGIPDTSLLETRDTVVRQTAGLS